MQKMNHCSDKSAKPRTCKDLKLLSNFESLIC